MVVGFQLQGALDERVGFLIPVGAVREGVSQGVEGVGVVRLARDDLAHVALQDVQPAHPLGKHPARVQQVRIPGQSFERGVVDGHRLFVTPGAREQLALGPMDAHRFPEVRAAQPVQVAPGRFEIAALREQHRDPDLRVQPLLAAANAPVPDDRVVELPAGFRDPGEVVMRRVTPCDALRERLELPHRLVEPVRLHQQQSERVAHVVVAGLVGQEALELRARRLVAFRIDEHAGVGHADRAFAGDTLEIRRQHGERAFEIVHVPAHARPCNRGPRVTGVELEDAVEQRRRLLEPSVAGEQAGERGLRHRVVLAPGDEPPHHGHRRFPVLLPGKEITGPAETGRRRIGQHFDDLPEMPDRRVEVAGPYQQGHEHLPRLDVRRIDLAPQARRLQGLRAVARERRDLHRLLRDARVPGLPGDVEVALERERQVSAPAGELCDQQLEEHVPGQAASCRRGAFVRGGRGRFPRRFPRLRADGGASGEGPGHRRRREPPEPAPAPASGRTHRPLPRGITGAWERSGRRAAGTGRIVAGAARGRPRVPGIPGSFVRGNRGHRRFSEKAHPQLRQSSGQCVSHYTSCTESGNRHDAGEAARLEPGKLRPAAGPHAGSPVRQTGLLRRRSPDAPHKPSCRSSPSD